MPFSVPPLKKIIKDGESDIAIALDVSVLPPFGVEKAVNISFSSGERDLYDHQSWIADQVIPSPKSDDQTIIDTASYEGVIRKQATWSAGPVTFVSSVALPVDTEMQSGDSVIYVVTASGQPDNGSVTVTVKAEDAGDAGNIAAGETLSLLSPVAGCEGTGIVGVAGITGGADIEPIDELLDRLLYRKRNPPVGGALHDYVIWAREMAGVSRAWAWDMWHGPATVGLAWVYDARDLITPTQTDVDAMFDYLYKHTDPAAGTPVGKPAGIEVWAVALTLKPVPMTISPTPDTDTVRQSVEANLHQLERTLSPGQKLQISSVRTAIGTATNITDYTLDLSADVTCGSEELITIGAITWPTA
ncbi:baseplate J/gp47 family protein [Salmonella enterica subsp. enterica]|nr:baseplate J/gp47 family protein [Salmonella enterica subsp. enterica serovar Tudu]